jgi:hypothetical protein
MKQFQLAMLGMFALAAILLSSCSRVPRQARYIPKDALAVVGVHTGKMQKELAWSAITGSGLLDGLRQAANDERVPAALKDLDQSGIDFSGTLYGYTRPDARFAQKMKMAAVLPVSDAGKLEAYVKKYFPGAAIRKDGDNSTAVIGQQLCLGWNDEVAILMKDIVRRVSHSEPGQADTVAGMPMDGVPYTWNEEIADTAASLAELSASLRPAKGSGIDDNDRFAKLEKAGHDISYWMSYDALVDMYYAERDAGGTMLSASVADMLMKGSAMATGIDFKKGQVEGLMRYYPADSLKDVAREFGKENVDADMLRRLPAAGLDMAGGMHLSPAVVKLLLQRLNLSGVANLALMSQGLTLDDVLGGFTGDLVFALNNFRMEQQAFAAGGPTQEASLMPKMDFVVAMKIGDKARLEKLLRVAGHGKALQMVAPSTYRVQGSGATLVLGDKYIAASSNEASAHAFLREHAGAMPDAVHQEISGHPAGLWADVQGILGGAAALAGDASEGSSIAVLQKTFRSVGMQGGEMKDGANEYRFRLRLADKRENSLLQLLHLAQQLSAQRATATQPAAINP